MSRVLTVLGWLTVAMGLLWVGQGLGYVHWPASSFMLDQRVWATRGFILMLAGLGVIVLGRRLGR